MTINILVLYLSLRMRLNKTNLPRIPKVKYLKILYLPPVRLNRYGHISLVWAHI